MATEIEIGGKTYLIGEMDVRDQLHILVQMTPLITPIYASLKAAKDGESINKIGMLMVTSEELTKIPKDKLDYVIDTCLNTISVQVDGGKPMKLMVNGRSMFGKLDLPTMIQLMWAVIMDHYRPFLSGLLDGPSNVEAQTSGT